MPHVDADTLHIVCYSGGHSSALVALAVAERFGTAKLVLLNHDINPSVEDADIKRFKREVSEKIGVPITYANHPNFATMDQFDVAVQAKAFKAGIKNVICTHRLKTKPFKLWLEANVPDKNCVIYYGFDADEQHRIQRRSGILGADGYQSDYPLALWPKQEREALVPLRLGSGEKARYFTSTNDVGVTPPLTYGVWKHANCIGCIKAKRQHWYCVYIYRPDVWEKAKKAEDEIGHSIQPKIYLDELEELFAKMKAAGVKATEKTQYQRFWADAKRKVKAWEAAQQIEASPPELVSVLDGEDNEKPCECVF